MQIADSCTFDGRRWAIEDWQGYHSCAPSNEDLGIETASPATNNWAGRVDHFALVRGWLYLFKVEVSLASDFDRARLGGRRRELLIRYEPMERFDNTGRHTIVREWRFENLVLDDCRIRFTGSLRLSHPYGDSWESPTSGDSDEANSETATLEFENGELIE